MRRPAASASGPIEAKCCRARISVGAIIAACAPAFNHVRHRQQRHDGLAGADIALQQPQHAFRLFLVSCGFPKAIAFLRVGQGMPERFADAIRQISPLPLNTRPAALLHLPPHQPERQLPGQQFVIGQPPARRILQIDIGLVAWRVQAASGFRESLENPCFATTCRIDPLRQFRHPRPATTRIALRSTLRRNAGGQRIDRFDQRQVGGVRFGDDMVRMNDGRSAVEPFDTAGDQHRSRRREAAFSSHCRLGVEEDEADLAGLVMGEDPVRAHWTAPARRGLVPVDA